MNGFRSMWGMLVLAFASVLAGAESPQSRESPFAFRLATPDGASVELSRETAPRLTVVCFLGAECPLARLYGPRLSHLHESFAAQGVRFIGVDSNSQDSPDDVQEFVREYGIAFPVAKDPGQKVADQFGARRTPEVFVLDQALAVVYHGRVDDQFQQGVSRQQPTRDDLRIALEEHLSGGPISVAKTDACGCLIGRTRHAEPTTKVTFYGEVSRVLHRHCVECHRPGEIGPFALTDYDEVAGWGETLLESIDAGRMPPWHANPQHGRFLNAREMPEAEKQILRDWVAGGMPSGDPADAPGLDETASVRSPRETFDLVLEMRDRPYVVPASGTVEYQYFVVDPGFAEERWVSAAQVLPGNRSVVHHALVFIRPPDGTNVRGVGWLSGYVPGQTELPAKPGYARRVPAGSKLVFQMHYTPNGAEQADLTRVGLDFIPAAEVTHEVTTVVAIEQEFEIPPRTANFPVGGKVRRLPAEGELLAIAPHMHVRGQSFRVTAQAGRSEQILLDVPRYDFNWQHLYALETPIDLAEIDALEFEARFDNSANNPANPDPTQYVTWGDQTWEEMALAFFEVAIPVTRNEQGAIVASSRRRDAAASSTSPEPAVDADAFLREFLQRFDRNGDGLVDRAETPLVFRTYGFREIDADHDGRLTSAEIKASARRPKRR